MHIHHQASFSWFNIQHVGYRLKWNVWFILPVVCDLVSGVCDCLQQTNTAASWNFSPKPVSYFTQVSSLVLTISLYCWKKTVPCSVEVKFPGEQLAMSSRPSSAARILTYTNVVYMNSLCHFPSQNFLSFFRTLSPNGLLGLSSHSARLPTHASVWQSPRVFLTCIYCFLIRGSWAILGDSSLISPC